MAPAMTWADSFLRTLKENEVRLVTYVPDNVLTPLIDGAAADNYFMSIGATREDEAVGSALSVGVGMRMFSFSARDCRSIAKN